MPLTTSGTFTCDRDGATADSADLALPEGWAQMLVNEKEAGQPLAAITGYLCPACAASFRTWLGKQLTSTAHDVSKPLIHFIKGEGTATTAAPAQAPAEGATS